MVGPVEAHERRELAEGLVQGEAVGVQVENQGRPVEQNEALARLGRGCLLLLPCVGLLHGAQVEGRQVGRRAGRSQQERASCVR